MPTPPPSTPSSNTSTTRVDRVLRAPRADVYRALLDSRAVARWMVPDGMDSVVHDFDAREGGFFRISLTYQDAQPGVGKSGSCTDTYHGRFVALAPNEKVVQVMAFETDAPEMQGEMKVTFELADAPGGGTWVHAVHEGVPPGVSPQDNRTGWCMALDKLAGLVEGNGGGGSRRAAAPIG